MNRDCPASSRPGSRGATPPGSSRTCGTPGSGEGPRAALVRHAFFARRAPGAPSGMRGAKRGGQGRARESRRAKEPDAHGWAVRVDGRNLRGRQSEGTVRAKKRGPERLTIHGITEGTRSAGPTR